MQAKLRKFAKYFAKLQKDLRKEFEKKYEKAIGTMSKGKKVDTGVAMDMLISLARNRKQDVNYNYEFTGWKEINFEELDNDLKILEDNLIVPKI